VRGHQQAGRDEHGARLPPGRGQAQGAARGQAPVQRAGRAVGQEQVARQGARVGFRGRREEPGRRVEREIRAAGGEATYVRADVRVPAQLGRFGRFVVRIAARYGGSDSAFDNAGAGGGAALYEMTVEERGDLQDTNVQGVFLAVGYEVPHTLRAGGRSDRLHFVVGRRAGAARRRGVHGRQARGAGHRRGGGARVRGARHTRRRDPSGHHRRLLRPPARRTRRGREEDKKAFGALNVGGLRRMAEPGETASAVPGPASNDFPCPTGASVTVDGGAPAGRGTAQPPRG
jgi:hypothetical protein